MGKTRRAHMMTLRLSLFIALIGVCHGLKNMADEVVPEKQQKQTTFYENDETGDRLLEVEGGCTNTPRWHDADGATYDCDWYSQGSNCATYGSSYAGVAGETANQACCVCQTAGVVPTPQPTEGAWTPPSPSPWWATPQPTDGATVLSAPPVGGSGAGSGVPTPQPTEAYQHPDAADPDAAGSGFELVQVPEPKQTVFVEGGCTNTPNWHDADGATYNCDWYSQGSNCAIYGSSYAGVAGETANQACCVCQTASSSTGATPQPTEGAWTPPAWMINEIAADNAAAATAANNAAAQAAAASAAANAAAQEDAAAAQADAAFYAALDAAMADGEMSDAEMATIDAANHAATASAAHNAATQAAAASEYADTVAQEAANTAAQA